MLEQRALFYRVCCRFPEFGSFLMSHELLHPREWCSSDLDIPQLSENRSDMQTGGSDRSKQPDEIPFLPFCASLLSYFAIFERLRFFLILEQVINRTRQNFLWKPPSSPCVPLRNMTWNIPRQWGTKERRRLLSSPKQTPLLLKREKGISLQPE